VFLGGDLLPRLAAATGYGNAVHIDFVRNCLIPNFTRIRDTLKEDYLTIFVVLDNHDPREAVAIRPSIAAS
jgi:hypothetical protein